MIRHGPAESRRTLPICRVAAVAISGQCAAVIAVHMAQRAGDRGVRARQRKSGRAVIERGSRPVRCRMANGAIRGEAGGDVIRDRSAKGRRAVPIRRVAAIAGGRAERVVVAHVA